MRINTEKKKKKKKQKKKKRLDPHQSFHFELN